MPFLGRFGPQPRNTGCAATVGIAFGVPDAVVALVLQLVRGNRGELSRLLRLHRPKETQPCRGLSLRRAFAAGLLLCCLTYPRGFWEAAKRTCAKEGPERD